MPLPDILQWAAAGRKTGTLHVARRSIKKRIILRDGHVYSSWSNDPRESLGQFLVRLRLATEEQLFRALLAQEEKGRPLGSILVGGRRPRRRGPQARAPGQGRGDDLRPLPLARGRVRVPRRRVPGGHPDHDRDAGDAGDPRGHPPRRRVAAHPRRLPDQRDDLHAHEPAGARARATRSSRRRSRSPRPGRRSPRSASSCDARSSRRRPSLFELHARGLAGGRARRPPSRRARIRSARRRSC